MSRYRLMMGRSPAPRLTSPRGSHAGPTPIIPTIRRRTKTLRRTGAGERPRPVLTQGIGARGFGRHGILQARKTAWALPPLSVGIAQGPSQSKAKARNRHLGTATMTGLASQAMPRGLRDEHRGSSRRRPLRRSAIECHSRKPTRSATYRERGTHPRDRRSH